MCAFLLNISDAKHNMNNESTVVEKTSCIGQQRSRGLASHSVTRACVCGVTRQDTQAQAAFTFDRPGWPVARSPPLIGTKTGYRRGRLCARPAGLHHANVEFHA